MKKERYSFTALPTPPPKSDYFLQKPERDCHDSALGPFHPLSCDDVTDGIVTLISHNKWKGMAKCITASEALIAQLVYSGYKTMGVCYKQKCDILAL